MIEELRWQGIHFNASSTTMSENVDNQTLVEEEEETFLLAIPFQVRFGLFFASFILSLACYCFVLYHFIFNKVLRQALSNHTIIVLLLVNIMYELVGIPLFLNYFYHSGEFIPHSSTLCLLCLLYHISEPTRRS